MDINDVYSYIICVFTCAILVSVLVLQGWFNDWRRERKTNVQKHQLTSTEMAWEQEIHQAAEEKKVKKVANLLRSIPSLLLVSVGLYSTFIWAMDRFIINKYSAPEVMRSGEIVYSLVGFLLVPLIFLVLASFFRRDIIDGGEGEINENTAN